MLVSLYTVRVVLAELGAEDYGIYNVVAGVVTMFGFLSGSMASATQRFLSFSLGKGDLEQTCEVFTAGFAIHLAIALLFILAAETAGLWFVESKLNIPEARKSAASAVYQFTIAATVFNIIRVPYHALIIAHERMGFSPAMCFWNPPSCRNLPGCGRQKVFCIFCRRKAGRSRCTVRIWRAYSRWRGTGRRWGLRPACLMKTTGL